jgi:hypothetical protein
LQLQDTTLYTIIFGQRSHHISDDMARAVQRAISERLPMVDVEIDLSGSGTELFQVTLNTANIVALIKHNNVPVVSEESKELSKPFRPSLVFSAPLNRTSARD